EDHHIAGIERMRLAEPMVNPKVRTAGGGIEVDLFWPEVRLCVELDSRPVHERLATRLEDERRDEGLRGEGHTVVRLSGPLHENLLAIARLLDSMGLTRCARTPGRLRASREAALWLPPSARQ